MSDARQTVNDMAAESARGQTPAPLGQFLRDEFGTGGWLSRFFGGPRTFEVTRIVPFDDGGFLQRSCVFQVFARDHLLEGTVLPSGGSFGSFSLGEAGLRYLSRQQANVEAMLREEGRALDECAPTVLASLVAEVLGRERNRSHDVLPSAEHLATYEGASASFGGGYAVHAREFERVRKRIAAPVLTGHRGAGWSLEFCTVFGWMHDKQGLIHHRYRFSPEFRIAHETEVLSRRIFERTPSVRY